jgi:hypothetical protein
LIRGLPLDFWGQVLPEPLGHGLQRAGEQAGGIDEMLQVIPRLTGVAPQTLQSFVRDRTGKDAGPFDPPRAGA